jgi:hypothetical protein
MPQPLLPMFPSDVTEINSLMSFARREGTLYYFNGPMPVFSHVESDRASFAMFASQMVVNGNCTQAEVVRAFGISAISMKRHVKRYRQSGTGGFFRGRQARQPRVLTPRVLQRAQELIQQGMGRDAVAQELGLKSDTLRKAIKAGRIVEPLKRSETVADKSQRSVHASQAAMGMGCVRVEERVLAAFGGLVQAPTRFEAGRDVSCGGVLWALPALLANGLLHRPAESFKLPKGFYGVVHVLLLMGFLALARIKSLERLRFEAPGEWGQLLGLDRIPEVHTLRTKLGQMAQGQQVEGWSASLSQQWMEQAPELAGRLYLDGHVRVYHGHQTRLPRRYVAREKLCLRGTTDYWINDREGRPFFVVNTAANPGLIAVLRQEIIPRLLKEVPQQPSEAELQADRYRFRFVIIFDREGYSPELFAELWAQRIAAQTYRKGPVEDWPAVEFQEYEVGLPNGEKQRMKLAERGVWLGNKLWVREIRQLDANAHQTVVISTDFQSNLVQIARQMFARWAQENWFKYMIEHFYFEGLMTHRLEPVSETTRVVNPAARTLGAQLKSKAAQLSRRRAEYGAGELAGPLEVEVAEAYQSRQTQLRQTIEALEKEVVTLKQKRKEIPSHLTLAELPAAERFQQLSRAKKHLVDTIKMVAYRAETALAMSLRQHMARTDDARALLREIFVSAADLYPDETAGTLTVSLHHLSNAASDQLAAKMAEELNATETIFPGTKLLMVFKLVSS